MAEKEYGAFVKVYNLISHDDSFLEAIENTVNVALETEAAYSFPKDPSVLSEDIPIVVEIIWIPKGGHDFSLSDINSQIDSVEKLLGNLVKRQIIAIIFGHGYDYKK